MKKTCLPPLLVSVSSCITFSQIKDYVFFLLFVCLLRLPTADLTAARRRSLSNPLQRIPAAIISKVSNSAKREGNYIGIPTVTYTLLMTSRSGMDESAIAVAPNTTMDLVADLRRIQDKPPLNHLVLI